MFHRFLLLCVVFIPLAGLTGCGADTGTRVLDGEVKVDPDVGADVNDPEAMEAMMNADPTPPK